MPRAFGQSLNARAKLHVSDLFSASEEWNISDVKPKAWRQVLNLLSTVFPGYKPPPFLLHNKRPCDTTAFNTFATKLKHANLL
jgi:hypothetical protein